MSRIELLLIAVGLAMDSFAVSICKGLSMKELNVSKAVIVGTYFGVFQALFAIIGYLLGSTFSSFIASIDHWVAFVLLLIIGGNMIKESFDKESESINADISFRVMVPYGIATSIDALSVGITFSFFTIDRIFAFLSIALASFILCIIGVYIGHLCGNKFEKKAEFTGGVILILPGIKILFEHLGIL